MKLLKLSVLALLLSLLAPSDAMWADIFELTHGGRVTGVLIERGPDEEYVVRTDSGAVVTLTKAQVHKVTAMDDHLLEYEQRSRTMPDTVDAHRQLAQWCKQQQLTNLRDHHLQRILQLDPNDKEVRKSLGYQMHKGRWLTRDQIMEERGLRHYDGAYRTEQDIALREREKKREAAETDWFRSIVTWRRWLDNKRRSEEAVQNIREIRDPHAAPAFVKLLDREENPRVRELYLSTLGELKHSATVEKLVRLSLEDPEGEVRHQCLDHLLRVHQPVSLTPYVKALKDRNNAIVLRAAEALERIGDAAAISPLIDALVTTHRVTNPNAPPGELNASFSPTGGTGFSSGGGNKIYKEDKQNYAVWRALVELSGGQNFEYDERAWRHWFVNLQVHEHVDARRDE